MDGGLLVITLVALAAASYAQYRLAFHTATRVHLWVTRLLLLGLGIVFGWVTSQRYPVQGVNEALLFLSAFGVVHVPAAAILFIKRQRQA